MKLTVLVSALLLFASIGGTNGSNTQGCDVNPDLFFVLDGSGSVKPANFDKVRQFVINVATAFTISLTDTRVGVVQYSNSPTMECNLGDHPDAASFTTAINTMNYIGGATNTGAAMDFARATATWRTGPVPRLMIVLTDGKSQDSVVAAAAALAADQVTVYAIGVGEFDAAELLEIANGNSGRVFELADFDALAQSINTIVNALCKVSGICRSCGDPHTNTPDQRRHHFQGPCRYTFAKDCGNSSDFTVEVQHVPVPRRPSVSVVREVFVIAHGYEIGIHQGNVVTVNGQGRTPSFNLAGDMICVTIRGIWIHVQLKKFCVDIYYNGRHCVKVRVPPFYCDRLCGLCGNFNQDKNDDFMMPDMTIASNVNEFGDSWLVEGEDKDRCIGPPPRPPCVPPLLTMAEGMCGILTDNSGPFAACQAVVDPAPYLRDCIFDCCAQNGDGVCLCDNLEAYADACEEEAGLQITWRTATLCPLPCPPNSHYNPCASPCPPTCQDPNPSCYRYCVECCVCDVGYIMSGYHCVPIEECGCTDPDTGHYYELGETWVQDGERCVCRENNTIICKGCSFDIVFILDRSSSIGPYGMYIAEKYIAYIIKCLYGLDVDVGYIVFDCISKWLISLGLYDVNTPGLIPKIRAADFTGGLSRIGNAIGHMYHTANYRHGIPSAAVVLTDGVAYIEYPSYLYEIQANAAQALGIEMYAVAVGRPYFFNYAALANIAGGWDRVFDRFSCCALANRLLEDLCAACDVSTDLFFVLDGSGSVGKVDFEKVKQFVVKVAGAFTIGVTDADTSVGVVQYSHLNTLECNLGDHPDEASFVTAINTMTWQNGFTATGAAMEFARQNAAWRANPSFPRMMIVLTDGKSQDNVVPAAQALAADDVKVFAIGVGNYDPAELREIANGDLDCVFELADHDALAVSINMIVDAVCNNDDKCQQPKDSGPCGGHFPRWYFNSQTGQCEQFVYGGCLGNNNNFAVMAECEKACGKNLAERRCYWEGTSPFCSTGKHCEDRNYEVMDRDKCGDGACCWTGDKIYCCEVPPCPTLTPPLNGALYPVGAHSYQDVVTFTCNQGYELNGAPRVKCQADQTWSAPIPTCQPLQCPDLTPPLNGALNPVGAHSYKNVVTFTCGQGYELNGASSITCEADQRWSAPIPTCQPLQCPDLTPPLNGDLNPVGAHSYQDVVKFTCDDGYELNGASSITCEADQTWSAPTPTCQH